MVGCYTPDDPRFLPRAMRSHGYHTASIGKIHLVPQGKEAECIEKTRQSDGTFDYYGFAHVDLVNGHGMNCFGPQYSEWLNERVPDLSERLDSSEYLSPGINNEMRSFTTQSWTLPAEVHSGEYITQKSQEYLENACKDEKPFFLHVSYPDPHYPLTAPEPYFSMYKAEDVEPPLPPVDLDHHHPTTLQREVYRGACTKTDWGKVDRLIGTAADDYQRYSDLDWQTAKAIYYGMITMLDDQIGRLLDTLDKTGQADNTIVVFVSDHGEYMGDHGFAGKGFHYDSVIRTPLIMRGPGIAKGQNLDSVASIVDLAPTLLDLSDVPEPLALQGFSMSQALQGIGPLPHSAVMTENDDDLVPMRMRTLTTNQWKLTVLAGSEEGELYNRNQDPNELNNLWSDGNYNSVKQELRAQLAEHLLCAVDGSNGRVQEPNGENSKYCPKTNH
jgi:arylsulfatase A-like enzyme